MTLIVITLFIVSIAVIGMLLSFRYTPTKFPQKTKLLLALTALFIIIFCMGCQNEQPNSQDSDTDMNTTDSSTESTSEEPDVSEPLPPFILEGDKLTVNTDKTELRILFSSDIHHNNEQEWYGVSNDDRMQLWVDSIIKEHEIKPIDLLIINGDISMDFHNALYPSGRAEERFSEYFVRDYVSQLPDEIPVFIIAGNHDEYSNEEWKECTGYDRQGYVVIGNNLFFLLDQYYNPNSSTHVGSGPYVRADMDYITERMNQYPDHDVWFVSHYIDMASESREFQELVAQNDRVKGLFGGHIHFPDVKPLGEEYNNKVNAFVGNFSYSKASNLLETFWGFRELIITEDGAVSNYIMVECDAVVNGKMTHIERKLGFSHDYNSLY